MVRFVSLFAGIGGFDLGFERAGLIPILQVEKDKNCLALLGKKWPDVPKMENVKNVSRKNFTGAIDIICGGFPCQDVSVAGQREGLAGERSGLWFEFLRIIEDFRPQWVIIENVTGLLSSNGGRDMGTIIGGLAKLGYWWAYRCLDAQYFGVPQRRRRVFIIASLTRGCPQEVLFEPESSPWDTPPRRETGAEIAGILAPGAHPGGLNGRDAESGMLISSFSAGNSGDSYGVAYSENITPPLRASNSGTNQTPTICFAQNTRDEVRLMNGDGQIAGALSAQRGMKQQNYIAFGGNNTSGPVSVATACNAHGSGRYDFESETFICIGSDGQNDRAQYTGDITWDGRNFNDTGSITSTLQSKKNGGYSLNYQPLVGVRRLTPLECERLQGFPDHWTAGQSDSARYRQLGNAVAVPVAEWLGKRITAIKNERTK